MPDTLDFTGFLDWRDRDLLPAGEPVTITGHDEGGYLRMVSITWGEIQGDLVETALGLLAIETVTRDSDRPIHEEELEPHRPSALRDSTTPEWPSLLEADQPDRWEQQLLLARAQNPFWSARAIVELAAALGVTVEAVQLLGVDVNLGLGMYLVPERDAEHEIVGLATRLMLPYRDEQSGRLISKGFVRGGRRGLYYADCRLPVDSPIMIPEGFSDTAACLSMGLTAVGRPSATGGVRHLLYLLDAHETSQPLIIISDRDAVDEQQARDPVGLAGARRTAARLATYLQRPFLVAFPPNGHKDTRDWLRSYCNGDLSPERLAAAGEVFLEHVLGTAETIQPGPHYDFVDDDREVITLDECRAQMRDARTRSVDQPGHYADLGPTGAGKTYADRALIQKARDADKTVLLVMPTHANCREEVRQLGEAGIEARAYPELSGQTCHRYPDASCAVQQGLDMIRAVCTDCRHLHDNSCPYRQMYATAQEAQVAVCTTARLAVDQAVSWHRDVVSVHEVADDAICRQVSLGLSEILQARRVLQMMADGIRESDEDSESLRRRVEEMDEYFRGHPHFRDVARRVQQARIRDQETREFIEALVAICDVLLRSLRAGSRTEQTTALDMPGGYWAKHVRRFLDDENEVSDAIREIMGDDRIDGATLRGLTMIARGASWDVMSWPVETSRGREHRSLIMVRQPLQFCDDQTWLWQDATGNLEQLERLLGRPVTDVTPSGRLDLAQPTDVVPVDISRKTAIQTVANAIRMEVIITACERLGVIGHKVHIDELLDQDKQLLSPEIRSRIHMMSYYGAGLDRGSNQWLRCDRLLILGTPRIGDDAVRAELWRQRRREATGICEPGWGEYTWRARVAGSGEGITVAGRAYTHPEWHAASLQITRAAIRQAVGRARGILRQGIPCRIWTTEALSEYPVRTDPQPHSAVVEAIEILWLANLQPQEPSRGVRIVGAGRAWLRGAEVARRLERDRGTACRVLISALEMGFVDRGGPGGRRWSICKNSPAE